MSACRTCNAQILWAKTERGKTVPLDAIPVALETIEPGKRADWLRGAFALVGGVAVSALKVDSPGARELRVSHFVTCPDRDIHRKPRT